MEKPWNTNTYLAVRAAWHPPEHLAADRRQKKPGCQAYVHANIHCFFCKHTFFSCESCLALTGRPCLSCRAICSCGTCSSHPTVQRCCAATGACIACPYQCDALTLKAFLQYLRCTDCRAEPDMHPAALCFLSIYKRYRIRTWCRTWYITWYRTWYSTWYRTWYRIRTAALHLRQW